MILSPIKRLKLNLSKEQYFKYCSKRSILYNTIKSITPEVRKKVHYKLWKKSYSKLQYIELTNDKNKYNYFTSFFIRRKSGRYNFSFGTISQNKLNLTEGEAFMYSLLQALAHRDEIFNYPEYGYFLDERK